jgi:hypothetical protein
MVGFGVGAALDNELPTMMEKANKMRKGIDLFNNELAFMA